MSGFTLKRGDNTIIIGIALLVIGATMAIGGSGFGFLLAAAGLVTGIIGIGRKREKPATKPGDDKPAT